VRSGHPEGEALAVPRARVAPGKKRGGGDQLGEDASSPGGATSVLMRCGRVLRHFRGIGDDRYVQTVLGTGESCSHMEELGLIWRLRPLGP
jgi:hypothetical protein